jgi:hypothetical protein
MTQIRIPALSRGREVLLADLVDIVPDGLRRKWTFGPLPEELRMYGGSFEFNGQQASLFDSWADRRTVLSTERLWRTLRNHFAVDARMEGTGPDDVVRIDCIHGMVYLVEAPDAILQVIRTRFPIAEDVLDA